MSLLSISADAKTVKGEKQGYLTGILYLAPASIAGVGNLCPNATAGCKAACLYSAGRGAFNSVQTARIAKTKRFHSDRAAFMAELVADIAALVRKAKRSGMTPVVRLNGTSDLPWENITVRCCDSPTCSNGAMPNIMAQFPDVQFYDYTKSARRALAHARGEMPANYHLTFSRSECNEADALTVLAAGGNVAVVFDTPKTGTLPRFWRGYRVLDGDTSDLRFADPRGDREPFGVRAGNGNGYVVGLKAKGAARRDTSGFVVGTLAPSRSSLYFA
jgi:hypothetical protein